MIEKLANLLENWLGAELLMNILWGIIFLIFIGCIIFIIYGIIMTIKNERKWSKFRKETKVGDEVSLSFSQHAQYITKIEKIDNNKVTVTLEVGINNVYPVTKK